MDSKPTISKELLSRVIGNEVLEVLGEKSFGNRDNYLQWRYDNTIKIGSVTAVARDGGIESMNIYQLAHKCKEWALTKNCSIESTFRNTIGLAWVVYTVKYDGYDRFGFKREHTYKQEFHADTEPEAIFKACQWILDNKVKK